MGELVGSISFTPCRPPEHPTKEARDDKFEIPLRGRCLHHCVAVDAGDCAGPIAEDAPARGCAQAIRNPVEHSPVIGAISADRRVLGKGWSFPVQVDPNTGDIAIVSYEEDTSIRGSQVISACSTRC